jgi:chromosome segregation protein
MLKALELSGFKSFADRTRFEFPAGICVVVGPNGSGKSNVVDAVKWVLGSQSAKSLRGKEMTDVIFNGCASRSPLGTAEVTLILDNADGRLPIDSKEVHVTRRVFRSGEGEYLLNRQPCRLRDIRDVLANTGITTEAYCIIEQGKVDALLQSSPRDRRVIFEEAAGISQFKVKKATAARRMERVEQNLLRLSDIVEEVESRLRSVRAQAGKARKYRECTERLQQLRTEVALVDWRTLTKQLSARETQLAEVRRRTSERNQALEQAEAKARQLEIQLESSVHGLREIEAAASATREQIASRQATVESQRARRSELLEEVGRIREQLAAMCGRTDGDDSQFRDAAAQLRSAEAELAKAHEDQLLHSERAAQSLRELEAARAKHDQLRATAADAQRMSASLAGRALSLENQLPAIADKVQRDLARLTTLARQREDGAKSLALQEQAEADVAAKATAHQASLKSAEQRLAQVRRELSRADGKHRHIEAELTRVQERIAVISELEERLEGLNGGIQDVLRKSRELPAGPLGDVRGVVADLFHVDVDSAPLVEMALGERTQFAVITSAARLLESLVIEPLKTGGRVGFLSLEHRTPPTALDHVDLSAEPGVMGRADSFVESAPEYQPFVRQLLGRTWIVDRLSTALRLSRTTGRGLDFVTADGELMAADGTLIVGPRHAAAGILSRRSELRACRDQLVQLDRQLTHQASIRDRLEKEREVQEELVASGVTAVTSATAALADLSRRTSDHRGRLARLVEESERIENDLQLVKDRIQSIKTEIDDCARRQSEANQALASSSSQLSVVEQEVALAQRDHAALQTAATSQQILTARCEQRVEMLRHQLQQAERSQQERQRAAAETRDRLTAREEQIEQLDAAMLAAGQELADLFLSKERQTNELAQHIGRDDTLRALRASVAEQIRADRQQLSSVQAQEHRIEVTAARLRHERNTLCERMKEDYGIDLEAAASDFGQSSTPGDPGTSATEQREPNTHAPVKRIDRDAVEREISELRNQLSSLGAINLESLDELDQIEARFEKLSSQYHDLVEAKSTLERIIHRINADSRNLFLTTLDTVRGHFQELFRQLFGGGEADIVVDEAEDVLECGIEIVARPPGKEACSISLLSGGEKTLTCVALLLAVFRSKPSPFCVLDEVDAALDEANIGRFITVLKEFLSFTQFIVVTHSKKTMAGADTLYGVTMEESGVSKRVSVRFEDVTDDGHIRTSALHGAGHASNAGGETPARRAA